MSSEVKQRIIEYAAWQFASNGIKNITMDELAEQLGMSKRTIYELFKDKKTLVNECISFFEQKRMTSSKQIFDESSNTFEALLRIFKFNFEGMQHVDKKFIDDIKKYFPEISKEREKTKKCHTEESAELFKKGMEEGFVVKDFDPRILSVLFSEEMDMIINAKQFNTSKIHFMEVYKTMCLIFFRGIATQKGIEVLEEIMNDK